MMYCCEDRRREWVRKDDKLNGIDFLEVRDDPEMCLCERQRSLTVHFIRDNHLDGFSKENFRIVGGERIRQVAVIGVERGTGDRSHVLTVQVEKPGDFSVYSLRLVRSATDGQPPTGFDVLLSAVDFSFKVACPSDFDCQQPRPCPPQPLQEPEIDYLAKDYASFRQLMLDRLSVLLPQWKERNPADVGIALVELLAYVGDYLSYQQDAVATEAYLSTARRRVSVRRHARLVDYFMHDGCNARVWVQVLVDAEAVVLPAGTQFLTHIAGQRESIPPGSAEYGRALATQPEVFETLHEITLREAHHEMNFYTWGDERCCLLKGATQATLINRDNRLGHIAPGDVVIFEEVRGPISGKPEDADPSHRHAIRLTSVRFLEDSLFPERAQSPSTQRLRVVEIQWAADDALPFSLCLWDVEDYEHPGRSQPVSVARGNIVLADHGRRITDEPLGIVPKVTLVRAPEPTGDACQEVGTRPVFPRFRPRLNEQPLTQAATITRTDPTTRRNQILSFDPEASASAAFRWEIRDVLPAITLNGGTWTPRRDLLASDRFATEFVAEVEDDGVASLRFGDDEHGLRPAPDQTFDATYRVGNGARGNVAAESLSHIVTADPLVVGVRNPMPARGGSDPESIEHVRLSAPFAFRTQERAVTPEDYAAVAARHPQVQRAAATFRWTGSWYTVFVTVDRVGGLPMDAPFKQKMREHLERFRMAGHDVEIDGPRFVSLEIEMVVCVKPDYFRSAVRLALLEILSNRVLQDGRRGVFHPDNFTFGQPVFLSRVYAEAQAVAGVASVEIVTFQRQGIPSREALDQGKLALGRLEIARLDNEPNFAERGALRIYPVGGK
jgi:hypothetical protein